MTHHWLEKEELERTNAGPEHSLRDRPVHLLDWCNPFLVACFFAQSNRLPPQEDWVVGLRHEEDDQAQLKASVSEATR
jgi:hypothetical protein